MRLNSILIICLMYLTGGHVLGAEKTNLNNLSENDNLKEITSDINSNLIRIHVVEAGETLSSIARKYSIDKESIIQVNKLIDENFIFIGQNLKIIDKDLFKQNYSYKTDNVYHEIVPGENLTEISQQYGLSIHDLIKINNIKNPNSVKVGSKLKISYKQIEVKESQLNINSKESNSIINYKKYGPLTITSEKINLKSNKKLLNVVHDNGKEFIISLKCKKKEINIRGLGRKWKGWLPAKTNFEKNLLNDFC